MVPWHEAGNIAMSDVDVMVIGGAGLADLSPALRCPGQSGKSCGQIAGSSACCHLLQTDGFR